MSSFLVRVSDPPLTSRACAFDYQYSFIGCQNLKHDGYAEVYVCVCDTEMCND